MAAGLRTKHRLPVGTKVPRDPRSDPGRARFLSELPVSPPARKGEAARPLMAQALVRCHVMDVPVERSTLTKGVHVATLRALERHGLVTVVHGLRDGKGRSKPALWKPTDRGVEVVSADEPVLLGLRVEAVEVEHGTARELTGPKQVVLVEEPERVDVQAQEAITKRANLVDAARASGVLESTLEAQRGAEGRLRGLRQLAFSAGVDVRSEMRMVERMLDAMEAKIRKQARGRAA